MEFDSATNVATLTMKAGKTATKADAEAAFKGTSYGVSSFKEKKEKGSS